MFSYIKKIYGNPFRFEDRSVFSLILYKIGSTFLWWIYYLKYHRVLMRTEVFLRRLKNEVQEKKKSAFVFANGPSLSHIDLLKVKKYCDEAGFDLISINSFLSKSADILKPKFAVFADNVHFSGGDNQYTKDIDACKRLGVTFFAPAKYVNNDEPLMYGYCSLCDLDSNSTSNIVRPAGYYGVTAFFAISMAKMIGYENIYLCGFDNSYFKDFCVDCDGELFIHHKHYYDNKTSNTRVPSHYKVTSQFFFDVYRHFYYIEKITNDSAQIKNIALESYLSSIPRDFTLDVYKEIYSDH